MWDHLAYHLIAAGRLEELVATVKDLRYLANKILARSVYATEADLVSAEQGVPDRCTTALYSSATSAT